MDKMLKNFSKFSVLYFSLLIILGHYLMVNMALVILKAKFTEINKIGETLTPSTKNITNNDNKESFNLQEFRLRKLWRRAKLNALYWTDNTRGWRKNSLPNNDWLNSRQSSGLTLNTEPLEITLSGRSPLLNFYNRTSNLSSLSLRRVSTKAHAQHAKANHLPNKRDSKKNVLEAILGFFLTFFLKKTKQSPIKNFSFLKISVDHNQPYISSSEGDTIMERLFKNELKKLI